MILVAVAVDLGVAFKTSVVDPGAAVDAGVIGLGKASMDSSEVSNSLSSISSESYSFLRVSPTVIVP